MRIERFVWLLVFAGALAGVGAQELSGTWTLADNPGALTVTLRAEPQGGLTGSIVNNQGASYQITGEVADGLAAGVAVGTNGGFRFEAGLRGDRLILVMVEPGPNGLPDIRTAVELSFIRQGGGLSRSAPSASAPPTPQATTPTAPAMPAPTRPARAAATTSPAASSPAPAMDPGAVSDPGWGLSFQVKAGWKPQKNASGAILGHDTIPGAILVVVHHDGAARVQATLGQGLVMDDSNIRLLPRGAFTQLGSIGSTGELAGTWNGQAARARMVVIQFPEGGGAYVIGVSGERLFGTELAAATDAVAWSVRASDTREAAARLAGGWTTMNANRQRTIVLRSDGSFTESGESSYSGSIRNSLGDTMATWGTSSQQQSGGRWVSRGTAQEGVLILTYPDGTTVPISYISSIAHRSFPVTVPWTRSRLVDCPLD